VAFCVGVLSGATLVLRLRACASCQCEDVSRLELWANSDRCCATHISTLRADSRPSLQVRGGSASTVRADIHISEELSSFLHRLPGNDRLGHVWPLWRGQSRPARPASGVCRLNPQVQVQGAVDQVNPFWFHGCPFTLRKNHSPKPQVMRASLRPTSRSAINLFSSLSILLRRSYVRIPLV
jgi:hypothetical protein